MNAREAREAAHRAAREMATSEIDRVKRAVQSAVAEGKMGVYVNDLNVSEAAIKLLEAEGYKVKNHDDQRDGKSLEVRW